MEVNGSHVSPSAVRCSGTDSIASEASGSVGSSGSAGSTGSMGSSGSTIGAAAATVGTFEAPTSSVKTTAAAATTPSAIGSAAATSSGPVKSIDKRWAPGRSRSTHVVTPAPEIASVSCAPSTTSSRGPRTATRMPSSSATATAKGGIAVSEVPKAPVRASSSAPIPAPDPSLFQTVSTVRTGTSAGSAASARPATATRHPPDSAVAPVQG